MDIQGIIDAHQAENPSEDLVYFRDNKLELMQGVYDRAKEFIGKVHKTLIPASCILIAVVVFLWFLLICSSLSFWLLLVRYLYEFDI